MSIRKERNRMKQTQQARARGLMSVGIILAALGGVWVYILISKPAVDTPRPISQLETNDFHSLAFSPTDPETIFFGHHGGLMVSQNGGEDWDTTSLTQADAMALALPASDPEIMYAAGHDVFLKSVNGGSTWETVSTNLPGSDIHGFAADPGNADHLFAHVVGYGIFGSIDGGSTWSLVSDSAPPSTFNVSVGENSEAVYAAAGDAGLWQSRDGGQSWVKVDSLPADGAIAVTHDLARGKLYVTTLGSGAGPYVSSDDGKTWNPLGLRGVFLALAVSPLDPDHIIAVNDAGEVYASRDGGLTWPSP